MAADGRERLRSPTGASEKAKGASAEFRGTWRIPFLADRSALWTDTDPSRQARLGDPVFGSSVAQAPLRQLAEAKAVPRSHTG